MALELGDRLLEVGLVTRAQLARHGTQPHGAALARRLLSDGLFEDALAGFFVSEGFGPLQGPSELSEAEPSLLAALPGSMAVDFLVVPIRKTPSGVLLAMAVPSDRHLVREVSRLLGAALPTVARAGDLLRVLRAQLPDVTPPQDEADEPLVLELVRRRRSDGPARPVSLASDEPTSQRITANIRPPGELAVPAEQDPPEDDAPLPLVRHKPVTSSRPKELSKPPAALASDAPPTRSEIESAASERSTSDEAPTVAEVSRDLPANKVSAVVAKRFPAPERAPGAWRAPTRTSEYGRAKVVPRQTVPPHAPEDVREAPEPPVTSSSDSWDLPPAAPAEPRSGKLAANRAALPSNKGAAGDVTATLGAMKTAKDRDAIVRLACEGATTVGRSAVFLALRKGVLKGWDGAGQNVSRDSVRNLWIPTGSDSMFKRVLDSGAPFVGVYGGGIADGLFRAAVGSRGGDVAVWPVLLEGKTVGLLCVDDLRPGSVSRHRIETLTVAVAEAFRRFIHSGKSE